jgi:hypothetical protein
MNRNRIESELESRDYMREAQTPSYARYTDAYGNLVSINTIDNTVLLTHSVYTEFGEYVQSVIIKLENVGIDSFTNALDLIESIND